MIGSHNATNDITDSQGFSIQSYYDAVLNAITESDIYPNSYDDIYTAPVAGNMECAMEHRVDMKMECEALRFIDLNESDLHFTMSFKYTLDAPKQYYAGSTKKYYTYYIGPKRSFDIIGHYLLQSNNDVPFLDVVNSHYESFIDYIATINDGTADETTATVEKIRNMSPFVPGFYHTMTAAHSKTTTYTKEIKFRVPVTDWHVLRDLRWFQSWMGELKFQIYPTVNKFCIMPVWSDADITALKSGAFTTTGKSDGTAVDSEHYLLSLAGGFNQINTTFKLPSADAADTTCNAYVDAKLSSTGSVISDLELITRQSMLKPDVAAALQQNFVQVPLMFPILNWDSMQFASAIGKNDTATPALTVGLQHCDTGFLIFPRNANELTTFINPELEFRLQIGTKLIPQKSYFTVEDHRFTSMFYDGLNIKNNANFKLQNAVYNSVQPYTVYNEAGADGLTEQCKYNLNDRTNFCIPIPFTSDEWFQGGLSQPNTTLKLAITKRRPHTTDAVITNAVENLHNPVFVYCQDHILRIYSTKPGLQKQIDISTRSVGQILATHQP